MSTLSQVLDTVGSAVIRVISAPRGLDLEVRDVLIHDPDDPPEVGRGDLLLGVGMRDLEETTELVRKAAENDAVALVLKSQSLDEGAGRLPSEQGGVALLSIDQGTSWSQVLALMQSALTHGGFHLHEEKLGGLEAGDLFAFADAVAELVDAPVTIDDRMSRILAYSGRQEEADVSRAETLVGRKVPQRFIQLFHERGIFQRIESSRRSVYIDDIAEGVMPRLAVAIRAGDEVLGSMWAACRSEPSEEKRAAFEDAAKLAALHLLKHRAGADIGKRLEADLMTAALHGGSAAREAILRLGLRDSGFVVLAAGFPRDQQERDDVDKLQLRDLLSVEISALRMRAAAAALGNAVYALVSTPTEDSAAPAAKRLAQGLLQRCEARGGWQPVVGIGRHASTARAIASSRNDADAALHVLANGRSSARIASIDEVSLQALLLRFADFAREEKDTFEQKLRPLIESDTNKNTSYVESLRAFLEAFGDVSAASERLMVHPNTLRYRMAKVQEISQIDLNDSSERLAVMILLAAF